MSAEGADSAVSSRRVETRVAIREEKQGRGLMPDVNRATRASTRATLTLATCVIVGLLGVIYAYGLRTFMS